MATLEKFEDFEVWKTGRVITKEIYFFTSKGDFVKDFALKDQIRDAAISITSNIAEGHERDGSKERIQFLSYAKGSCGEVRSQLHIALDCGYISKIEFDRAHDLLMSESRMLGSLMKYLRNSSYKGEKYKKAI